MYTAPPSGEENDQDTRTERSDAEATSESETSEQPVLDPATGRTDANWTGTVPADD